MTKKRVRKYKGMKDYFQRTWKNKVIAIVMIVVGLLFKGLMDNDITITVWLIICGIMVFCARDDLIKG